MRGQDQFVARAFASASDAGALESLARQLGPGPFSLVMLFISPEADLPRLVAELGHAFPAEHVVGCTTAGEISDEGYDEGRIVALALSARHFAVETMVVPDLSRLAPRDLVTALARARQTLARSYPVFTEEFALLLVDGLSVKEDELAAALAAGTVAMPLIGGSAGDGTRFRETFVIDGQRLLRNAAVLSVVRGACPVRVFNFVHLELTERRMVVTEADPARRMVRRINAEIAAQEYARVLRIDPATLDSFTFAAHPLAVRIGARQHVRAIQQMLPSGELVFFAAIDEGLVLSVAEPGDLVAHLDRELERLNHPCEPSAILAFDCILRRLEAREKQMTGRMSGLLRRHSVTGFSTYGEQIGPLHVNQTMTGVAFYPPGTVLETSGLQRAET